VFEDRNHTRTVGQSTEQVVGQSQQSEASAQTQFQGKNRKQIVTQARRLNVANPSHACSGRYTAAHPTTTSSSSLGLHSLSIKFEMSNTFSWAAVLQNISEQERKFGRSDKPQARKI
jgi:hypothetical protein